MAYDTTLQDAAQNPDARTEPYVQERDNNLYVGKTRVTVDTVILHWLAGEHPEAIQRGFPSLTLAAIYGTIAYYLEHQPQMDEYLAALDQQRHSLQAASVATHPEFYATLQTQLHRPAQASSKHNASASAIEEQTVGE